MPAPEVIQSLADAIGGVDREAAFRKGLAERSDIDYTQAQTEAAIQQARERRLTNEEKERIAAAQESLREAEVRALAGGGTFDPNTLSPVDLMQAGFGSEFSNVQLGRQRGQEYNLTETVADPDRGFGNEIDMELEAALEALAPEAAITTRRMANLNLEPTLQPNGTTIYTPAGQAAGQRVGAPPSNAGGAATNAGGISSAVSGLIYRQSAGLYGGTYDPVSGRFAGLDREGAANVQRLASRASVIFRESNARGVQMDPQTAVDQALDEMRAAAEAGGTIPPQFGDALEEPAAADPFEGRTATGPNGEKLIKRGGQWVPLQ